MAHQHEPDEKHEHNHNHRNNSRSRLKIVLFVIVGIMLAEVIGGILSNSLALVGDAGHMLVDGLAVALSLFAITMAARPATQNRTFGYHRVEIMAALANGALLALVSAYIFYEAIQRFRDPPEVEAPLMLVVASIGLVANLIGVFLLKETGHGNLNVRAAFWHIIGDTISSVGVIAGGIIISIRPDLGIVDPIIAVAIGIIILVGSWRLLRESVDILMETVPAHVSLDRVIDMMRTIPGVEEVHDVHVWTLTSDIYALSAHLMIQDQSVSGSAEIVEKVNQELRSKYRITHTTLQLECSRCASCPAQGAVCNIVRPEDLEEERVKTV